MEIYNSLCVHIYFSSIYLALLLLPQFVHPIQSQAPLRYLHMMRGAVNFVLVAAMCYLKVTPYHNHY
jgi:hypothetical protein